MGMATNMPPHNLIESIDACIALLDNPELTVQELSKIVLAPDFPTGGIIFGYDGVREAYETGRGRILIRAKAEIEEHNQHQLIVITEIPYGVNRAELIKDIAQLVVDKENRRYRQYQRRERPRRHAHRSHAQERCQRQRGAEQALQDDGHAVVVR